MAKDKDDETVLVEDEGVVTVELPEDGTAEKDDEGKEEEEVVEAKPEPKPAKKAVPRVRLKEAADPVVEDATAALTESLKKSEAATTAALATAEAERRRREEADSRAATAEAERLAATDAAANSQITLVTTNLDNAERELGLQEAELTRAMEAGEFAKVASVQIKVSKLAATIDRLTAQKAELESAPKRTATTEGRVEAKPTINTSAFENYLAQFSPASQAWIRAHPECAPVSVGGEAQANAKMMAGHYDAVAKGFAPNTPDYFRVIEERIGARAPISKAAEIEEAVVEEKEEKKPAVPARKAAPSAPPSREPASASAGISRGTRQVILSKEQQEAAKISFPHLQPKDAFAQYARNLVELESEGKMGRLTH